MNNPSFKLLYIASSSGISRKLILIAALLCQQPGTGAASKGEVFSLYPCQQLTQHHKMVLCHNTQGGKRDRSLDCSAQVTGTIHTTWLFIAFDWTAQSLIQTNGMRQNLPWSTQPVRRQKSEGIREETKRKLFFFSSSQYKSAALGNNAELNTQVQVLPIGLLL